MSGIQDLRSRMKPTQASNLADDDKELNKTLGKGNRNDDYLDIDAGRNTWYIYPPHDATDPITGKPNPFAEPKVLVYLPAMVIDRDDQGKEKKDANGKVQMKVGVRPVFNAKIHGKRDSQGNPLSKDLVEEFIRLALEHAKATWPDDEDARKKYCLPIYGQYSKDPQKRINGIIYNPTWDMYVDKVINGGQAVKFGRVSIGKSVKERINKISAVEAANEPLGTDPFTPIGEQRALIVIYNPDADKPQDYYTTEIDNSQVVIDLGGGRTTKGLKTRELTDDQILAFYKKDSLATIFRNKFKRSDLDIQIAGLKMLDEKYKMGIWNLPEFQACIEELLDIYPPEEATASTTTTSNTTSSETTEQEAATETATAEEKEATGDMFDLMNREELKEFSKDNNTGIVIKPVSMMSDEMLRVELRAWQESKQVVIPEGEGTMGTHRDDLNEVELKKNGKTLSAKERMELLKQQQGSK